MMLIMYNVKRIPKEMGRPRGGNHPACAWPFRVDGTTDRDGEAVVRRRGATVPVVTAPRRLRPRLLARRTRIGCRRSAALGAPRIHGGPAPSHRRARSARAWPI